MSRAKVGLCNRGNPVSHNARDRKNRRERVLAPRLPSTRRPLPINRMTRESEETEIAHASFETRYAPQKSGLCNLLLSLPLPFINVQITRSLRRLKLGRRRGLAIGRHAFSPGISNDRPRSFSEISQDLRARFSYAVYRAINSRGHVSRIKPEWLGSSSATRGLKKFYHSRASSSSARVRV